MKTGHGTQVTEKFHGRNRKTTKTQRVKTRDQKRR
jgi:hypothetical protein